MDRRQAIKSTLGAAVTAASWPLSMSARQGPASAGASGPGTLFVNPNGGLDSNAGAKDTPLKTVAEAARRVNASSATGPMTIVLAEGIHAIGETTLLKPASRTFSRADRLTIRAEVLPDDPAWHIGRMPTLIHTLPLSPAWNGRPDPLGGAADGMLVDTSHVTVQGLRILGMPVVETPKPGVIQRLYAISRLRRDLDDLEIAQCLFAGDDETNPNHVGVIANGSGVNVHHCIFRGLKISVVYWTPGSGGHTMANNICHEVYGSGVWTAGIASDFVYRNNIVSNGNYVWTAQGGASALADAGARGGSQLPATPAAPIRYQVVGSYFARTRMLAGSGTGARLEYRDIDPSFLTLTDTKVVDQPIVFGSDATRRDYLHPVAGSEAAKVGAGLFTKV